MSALPKSAADCFADALDRITAPTPAQQWVLDQTEALARIRAEQDAEDGAYLTFRKSMEAGDSEAVQRAFFGNRFQLLLDRYNLEDRPLKFKCFDCEQELDDDENRAARADIAWCDPLCDECNAERNRRNKP